MRRLLPILALILALHPVSGATGVSGEGWGEFLRALFCGCPACASEEPEESSCCSDQERECPCTHELELPDEVPLSGPDGAGTRSASHSVTALAWLSATTPANWLEVHAGDPAGETREPPGPRLLGGPRELVAELCTARI